MKQIFIAFLLVHSIASYTQETIEDSLLVQEGIASYYAQKFHGRLTASGDEFHIDSLTAAHKSLPFGTYVKVTNLSNDKSVIVKINDRGMKGMKRIIDLSPAAAKELGMIKKGLQKVRVEKLPK